MMAAVESSVGEEVSKLMGQGKRHLVCSEVVQAVKCFEEATQKLDNKFGAGSDECGEAYLFYGKALLELARAENGVLGNALKDVEPKSGESSDEDEDKMEAVGPKISEMSPSSKEKIREDVQEAMAEKEEGGAETKGKDKEGKDQDSKKEDNDKGDEVSSKTEDEGKDKGSSEEAVPKEGADEEMKEEEEEEKENKEEAGVNKEEVGEKDNKEEKEKEEAGVNKEAGEKDNEGEEEDDEEGGEEEGEEEGKGDAGGATTEGQEEDADVPTMQLAWEFLELARIVFLRHDNKEAQLNLAEVQLKLGEIQLEQEQFEGAVADFLTCLELQEKHLEPDNRLIAETAYNLGLAYSLQQNYAKAKEFYSKALQVIELKTTKLEARLAESESKNKGKGKATDDNPCVVDRKELEELQNLYPEIKARVDDAQEMMNSAANQPESTTEEGFGSSGLEKRDIPTNTIPIKQVSSQMPVTDVSHLVRRKRKPEEESSSAVKEDTGTPVKKPRQDEDQPAPVVTENGHAQN